MNEMEMQFSFTRATPVQAGAPKPKFLPVLSARVVASLLFVLLLATGCSTPQTARFSEQERADLIVRYYTDDTSYLLKPLVTEGAFLSILDRDAVLKVAKQQPGRQLAVVILIHYNVESQAEAVKNNWKNLLGACRT